MKRTLTRMIFSIKLMLLIITIKFQFIQTEFSDKEDYFNHSEDALPDFIVDNALLITKKSPNLSKNPPWITEKTIRIKPPAKATITTKSKPVSASFDTKVKWVELPHNQVIRSNKNNDTNVSLPIWSSKSTSRATTESTTQVPTRTTTRSTRTIPTATTPSRTTTTTPRSTSKSTTTPTTTTSSKVFTTTISSFLITYKTKNLFPIVPVWPKITTPRFSKSYITMTTATGKPTASYHTVTATLPSTRTTKLNTPTTTKASSFRPFPEANLNRMVPETTVFQDLTMKRHLRGDEEETDDADGRNTPDNEIKDEKKPNLNKLQDKEVIEYQVLETEPFSKFLELLMKQLAVMDSMYAAKFLKTFERQFAILIKTGIFDVLGPITTAYMQDAMDSFRFPIDHKQRLLSMAHNILANRNNTLSPDLNALLDYMDMLYAVEAEVQMERVLNETRAYPNTSKTAEEISEGFLEDVLVNPLKIISGTTQGNKLISAITDIITNNKHNLIARRVLIRSDNDFYKINKKSRSSHNYRSHRRRPKLVIARKHTKTLFRDENDDNDENQMTKRNEEDRHRNTITIPRKNKEDINNDFNFDSEEKELSSITKNGKKTTLDKINVSKEINNVNGDDNEKIFRAYNSYNSIRPNKMINNPFRTLLYGKGRKDRFEAEDTLKETHSYFQRTRPTTKTTEPSIYIELTTNDKKIGRNLDKQSTHESNIYHKQKFKYKKEVDKNKIKDFVHALRTREPNSYHEEEFEENDSDEKFTTTAKIRHKEKPKVTELKSTKKTKSSKNILKDKFKTTKYKEISKTEFREANISLKHFYFKPVIVQNKSGDINEFVSIEFDNESNMIDFSMKVKLKTPITPPMTYKATGKRNDTEAIETTASPTTDSLRILNPYKMDNYFKNKSEDHDVKNDTAGGKEPLSDDSSLSDDLGESRVSLEEETDSQTQVFGKLRKFKNIMHKKKKIRSKKHRKSKKHHHNRKHEKHKRHRKHGKHGKKHKHKYLQAYFKKNSHNLKKRIKHKIKQLKNKRIVGKNFEIAFDASSGDSDDNLIDVTIVERAGDGKRATISLVNKDKKLTSSYSSISKDEEDTKNAKRNKKEKNSSSSKSKHKRKQNMKTTTTATTTVVAEGFFNLDNIIRDDDNNTQEDNKTDPNRNAFKTHPKMANGNRKRKKLSPMLIEINKQDVTNTIDKVESFGQLKNKSGSVHRRFFPFQVFNDSEYSDEEAELKNNLYDAFRHKDDVYYRRNLRHEVPLRHELRVESDVTDEEIILKQNIYKAIKANNRRAELSKREYITDDILIQSP